MQEGAPDWPIGARKLERCLSAMPAARAARLFFFGSGGGMRRESGRKTERGREKRGYTSIQSTGRLLQKASKVSHA